MFVSEDLCVILALKPILCLIREEYHDINISIDMAESDFTDKI